MHDLIVAASCDSDETHAITSFAEVFQVLGEKDLSLDALLQQLVSLLPLLWPQWCSPRIGIRYGEHDYGDVFSPEDDVLESPLPVHGETRGTVRINVRRSAFAEKEAKYLAQMIGAILEMHVPAACLPKENGWQANKMHNLTALIPGLSHEINNPINSALLGAENLIEAWKTLEPVLNMYSSAHGNFYVGHLPFGTFRQMVPKLLSDIIDSLRRIEDAVAELRNFVRQCPDRQVDNLDVNAVLNSSLALLKGMLKKSTYSLEVSEDANLPAVRGNYQELEQAIINLIHNACKALQNPKQGIRISTGQDEAAGEVIVTVRDEGSGISQQDLTGIMDSLHAKQEAAGISGTGLTVASEIINLHSGRMELSSEIGKGTTVKVILPIAGRASVQL